MGIFFVLLRSVAVPYVAFLFLRETMLGESGATLAIALSLTLTNLLLIVWNGLKIIPNIFLLRGKAITMLIFKITIQVSAILFSWFYYLTNFVN